MSIVISLYPGGDSPVKPQPILARYARFILSSEVFHLRRVRLVRVRLVRVQETLR